MEDPSARDDVLEQYAQPLVVGRESRSHGPLCGLALVGLWRRPAQGLLGGREAGEAFLDLVGVVLGKQNEDDRAVVAGLGSRSLYGRLGHRPLVANPDRNVALASCGLVLTPMDVDLARRLACTVGEFEVADRGVDRSDQPLAAELVDAGRVVADGGKSARVVLLPLGVLLCEEAVLIVDAARCARRRRAHRAGLVRACGAERRPQPGLRPGGPRGTVPSLEARSRRRARVATSAR